MLAAPPLLTPIVMEGSFIIQSRGKRLKAQGEVTGTIGKRKFAFESGFLKVTHSGPNYLDEDCSGSDEKTLEEIALFPIIETRGPHHAPTKIKLWPRTPYSGGPSLAGVAFPVFLSISTQVLIPEQGLPKDDWCEGDLWPLSFCFHSLSYWERHPKDKALRRVECSPVSLLA